MNHKFALASLLVMGLSACGSDSSTVDDGTTTPPSPPELSPEMAEVWSHIDTPYHEFKESKLEGIIYGYLGYQEDTILNEINKRATRASVTGDMSADLNGDGWINQWDVAAKTASAMELDPTPTPGITIDPGVRIQSLASQIHKVLATNPDGLGAGTSRPDIFVEGHLSVFDYLRYLAATRKDLRFEGEVIRPEDSKYGMHEFRISWDRNGDGLFNGDDNTEYEINYNSDDWYYTWNPASKVHYGTEPYKYDAGYKSYRRMDQHWLTEDYHVRFYSAGEVLKNRRDLTWQWEQDWLAKNDGKVVVKGVYEQDGGRQFRNLEIRAFNVRNDVYQPDVITGLDYYLSFIIDHGFDIKLSYWPTVDTGTKIDSFIVEHAFDRKTKGSFGTTIRYYLQETSDFKANPNCAHMGLNGKPSTSSPWREGTEVPWYEDGGTQEECHRLFGGRGNNGGLRTNYAPTNDVLWYGVDLMTMVKGDFGIPELNYNESYIGYMGKDHIYRSDFGGYDINTACGDEPCIPVTLLGHTAATEESTVGNAPVLDESHFGWKMADCSSCHNEDKNPLGHGGQSWPVNAAAGFDEIQPYYCATCHGNNGAPQRHNYDHRCTYCHNPNNTDEKKYGNYPKNHGEISNLFLLTPEANRYNQKTATEWTVPDYTAGKFINVRTGFPTSPFGELELYPAFWVPHNNNYTLSKSYPDPYACTTCHTQSESN